MGKIVIDLVLSGFPQGTIIECSEYGFYMSYIPDHFYAWRDEGKTWAYHYQDFIPRSHSY